MEKNCANCMFFAGGVNHLYSLGECHRYPKYIDHSPKDWCGEFSSKETNDALNAARKKMEELF